MVDRDIMKTSFASPACPSPSSLSTVSGVMVIFLRPSAGRLAGFGEANTWALLSSCDLTFDFKPCRILKISLGNGTPLSFGHSLSKWWVFSSVCSKVMVWLCQWQCQDSLGLGSDSMYIIAYTSTTISSVARTQWFWGCTNLVG